MIKKIMGLSLLIISGYILNNKSDGHIYERYIKRPQDILCACIGLVGLSPVLGITAFLIRHKLGSPVLFTQERPGRYGEIFKLYKFRSMTDERDANGELLANDKRMTDFGRKLRATSIDELPELFNVLKGDMSIVGPRPLLKKYLRLYSKEQSKRHDVRPGITGLAQVNGRNAISWDEKFKYDVEYVNNVTFKEDWKIILKTVINVFKRKDINASDKVTMGEFKG